ncbi:MFS transporter [Galbitalea soli]|uniref:MFS transporter n=1 Tax=Galbitalea soli TaxID=1268042 RepID=A0A7C9TPN7_9MICO|nr:MFS transporter [Galbitalea soli]NEM90655.1 MFS transporter [Galbitalea soli]NYJ31373.1 MFS family permease [Galbitalea soli]
MPTSPLGSYGPLFAHPGAPAFVAFGWLGRMSRATTGISSVLLVAAATGSYALGGAVAGAVVVGGAIGGPLWARASDAVGQRRVLPLALGALALSAAALACAVLLGAAVPLWFVFAFLIGGSSIDTGSLVRARWASILRTQHERHTALALEAVNDELVYVVGPPFATLLATVIAPVAGLLTGVAVALLGGLGLLSQRRTAPRPAPLSAAERRTRRRRLMPPGVLAVFPLYPGVGIAFGSIDVSSVGVGNHAGHPWLAGIIVAVYAGGSVVAGLAFGQLGARWSVTRKVITATIAFGMIIPALLASQSVPLLIALIFAAGLVTTPVLISGASLIETRVDPGRLTEAMAWPQVGLSVGVIVGSTLAGVVIDHDGAFAGYAVAAIGALVVAVLGVASGVGTRRRAAAV